MTVATAIQPTLQSDLLDTLRHGTPTDGLVLYLPGLDYGNQYTGTILDYSGRGNHGTITGATGIRLPSGLWALNFTQADGNYVTVNNASSITFTTENWTLFFWIWRRAVNTQSYFFDKGVANTDGWYCRIQAENYMNCIINQAGANQQTKSTANPFAVQTWSLIAFTRSGTKGYWFVNGVDVTDVQPALTDPATNNRDLLIGIDQAKGWANSMGGYMWGQRLLSGVAHTATQQLAIYQRERHLFGV